MHCQLLCIYIPVKNEQHLLETTFQNVLSRHENSSNDTHILNEITTTTNERKKIVLNAQASRQKKHTQII